MKRLAVFCDGTWNDLRMPSLTNVARLAKCVESVDDRVRGRPIQQIVFYDNGVGVTSGISGFTDWLTGLWGGAFGRGLDEKIEAAYRFLVLNYEPGDEIYIFGFSRGAYTARSLCGLIRKCGIVRRDCFDRIPEALANYRDRNKKPAEMKTFRDSHTYRTSNKQPLATGWEDLTSDDKPEEVWAQRHDRLRGAYRRPEASDEGRLYRMMYLGLWDTVGSLGVPTNFPLLARLINPRYAFHDTDLSALIRSMRHAAAVNEDRRVFDLTPVSNVRRLNIEWARGGNLDKPDQPRFIDYRDRPYQQRWFPGDHGAVGGGNPERGLYSSALLWVAEGAERAGLYLRRDDKTELAEAVELAAPLAEWRIRKDGRLKSRWAFDLLGFIGGYLDRTGPATPAEAHETTALRIAECPDYRPPPLQRFTGEVWRPREYRLLAFVLRWLLRAAGLGLAVVALLLLLNLCPGLNSWAAERLAQPAAHWWTSVWDGATACCRAKP